MLNNKKNLAIKDKDLAREDDLEEEEMEIKRLRELALAYEVYNQLLLENSFIDFGYL